MGERSKTLHTIMSDSEHVSTLKAGHSKMLKQSTQVFREMGSYKSEQISYIGTPFGNLVSKKYCHCRNVQLV